MTPLFPEVAPFRTHHLKVSDRHTLYIEESGNPNGLPLLFLHGGPGGGFAPVHRRLFDPQKFHAVLFDQRGAGKSTPHADLEENTTWDLVADIEKIRKQLGIQQWLVFGGSWGSTLALAYAQAHPASVSGLILRGIFLCRPEEITWFYQRGCDWVYPDFWEEFVAPVPQAERHDMVAAYYRLLTHSDPAIRVRAAQAWSRWEGATCKLIPNQQVIAVFEEEEKALAMARIECHYFVNHCFFTEPNQLLKQAHRIQHIPTWIVHGRYDVVCPVKNAWELYQVLPQSKLCIVPDAGHAFDEPGILKALLQALEEYSGKI